jgi:hypothetical protein
VSGISVERLIDGDDHSPQDKVGLRQEGIRATLNKRPLLGIQHRVRACGPDAGGFGAVNANFPTIAACSAADLALLRPIDARWARYGRTCAYSTRRAR